MIRLYTYSSILFFFFFIGNHNSNTLKAQSAKQNIESLFVSLPDNSLKVDSLNKISRDVESNEDAIVIGLRILKLAKQINYRKGEAQALNNIGVAFYNSGKANEALEYHQKAMLIRKELENKKDISASYTNMGNAYDRLGNKKRAIEYHTKSLALKTAIRDSFGMALSYNNICLLYTSDAADE